MDKIRILHISDLHYGKEKDILIIIEKFFEDLDKIKNNIDMVIFSGDLVQYGNTDLLKEANEKFIVPLLEKLKLTINDFFIVPGNHETNRNNISSHEKIIKKNYDEKTLQDIFNFSDGMLFIKKLEEFNQFKKDLKQDSVIFNDIYSTHKKNVKGKSIGISCLNSTLFCRKDDTEIDEGNLIISTFQISKAIESIKENDFKICVFHHGMEYFKDRIEIESILHKNYDLLLTGHVHKEKIEEHIINGQGIVKSIAGCLYGGSDYFNGYSILTISEEEIKINLRCYYPERNEYDKNLKYFKDGEYTIKRKNKTNQKKLSINYDMIKWTEEKASKKLLSNSTLCEAPKKIEDIFVEPIFSLKSQSETLLEESGVIENKEKEKKIYIKNILENKGNYIFLGEKESGKTTLINYMMLKILKNNIDDKIIPIYFKGENFKSNKNFINEILKYLVAAGAKNVDYNDVKKLLEEGRFNIFIDDFNIESTTKLDEIEEKIIEYNNNRFLIFIKNNYGFIDLNIEKKINGLNFSKTLLYTKGFNKKQIKELTLKWKKEKEIDNKNIDKLIKNIDKIGIARTPHILSLILLVTENRSNFLPENKALLLDVFFDILLEKMNVNTIFSSINYNTKINYLSYIAKLMKEERTKEFLRTNLEYKTLEYANNLNLQIDKVSEFIDQFIKRGIFYEEDKKISFKYQSFYEFFIAKQMTESDIFREIIFNEETYFCTPEEIEYYSGLKSGNSYSLKKIFEYLNFKKNIDEEKIKKYEFNIHNFQFPTEQILEKVEKSRSNELIQAEEDIEVKPRYSKECQEINEKEISNDEKYIITLKLLSNIFRNCYLVEDKELRKKVFDTLILNYSYLLMKIDTNFKKRILNNEKIEEFFRMIICALFSEYFIDNLASEKIILFLKDKLEEKNKNSRISIFILHILYLNSFVEESLTASLNYVKVENNILFLGILQLNLLKYYFSKKCSNNEVELLKKILKEIYMKKHLENKKKNNNYIPRKKLEAQISQKVNSVMKLSIESKKDEI